MARPLNFLHLSTFYPPWSFGGDAMYLYRLARALGDEGHLVDVVHCLDAFELLHPGPPVGVFAPHPNVTVYGLRSGARWLSPLLTHQTGRPALKSAALRRILASRPYDVLHYHNISLLGPGVLGMSPPARTPLKLYTAHEHWLVCPMHVLWKYDQRLCDRPDCLRCTVHSRRPPQLWRYTSQLERESRHVHQFVTPSRFSGRLHAERGFSRPMECLPYFADIDDVDRARRAPRPHPRPYCLFVGRLEQIKGVQVLLSAWSRVPDVDLLVAGAGQYEAELRRLAGTNPRIRFLGHQSQASLATLYAHAIACVVPSLVYETFGIIVIEAFARKTPVIARELGALAETIQETGGGLLFRAEDDLVEAVHRLARDDDERARLGEAGYRAFVERFSPAAHLRQYHALLQRTALQAFGTLPWEA